MRFQGMEFTFNCGDKNPKDVVLELMQKVQIGILHSLNSLT